MRVVLLFLTLLALPEGRSESFPMWIDCGQYVKQHYLADPATLANLPNQSLSALTDHSGLDEAIQNFIDAHQNDDKVEPTVQSLLELVGKGYFPEISEKEFITPAFYAHFVINRAIVRTEHPDWSSWRVYLEATWRTLSGVTHTTLDVCGLIPVGGEPCDLINGVIYTLEGNAVDAGLSFSATLPIAGWAVTGAKWAGISVVVGSVVHHLNFNILNGLVDFGDRGFLRTVLGVTNPLREAHHVIPWNKTNHPLVQSAGKGNFHMNHPKNGMELEKFRFSNPNGVHANHPAYNDKVEGLMNALWIKLTNYYNGAANVPAGVAKDKLIELQQGIVANINANPNVKINDLTLTGVNVPNVP